MAPYQPTSRRPIARIFRKTADGAVGWCVRRGVHPDWVSYLSVVAAALAGACFFFAARWPWLLVAGALLCGVRLWFNMLDGLVALASEKASLRGEIVNELPDRVSDIVIFAGVAHSGLANPFPAYWAALLAVMTAYVGTLSQAVTGKRRFEGMMSKQWRMVTLSAGAVVAFGMMLAGRTPVLWRWPVLDWTNGVIVVGCLQTCYVRLRNTLRELAATHVT